MTHVSSEALIVDNAGRMAGTRNTSDDYDGIERTMIHRPATFRPAPDISRAHAGRILDRDKPATARSFEYAASVDFGADDERGDR